MLSLGVLFDVNYICILSAFFIHLYNSNAKLHPIHQYYTNPPFCNVLQNMKENQAK